MQANISMLVFLVEWNKECDFFLFSCRHVVPCLNLLWKWRLIHLSLHLICTIWLEANSTCRRESTTIRLTRLALVCEVIRYCLLQIRQNFKVFRVGASLSLSLSPFLPCVLFYFFFHFSLSFSTSKNKNVPVSLLSAGRCANINGLLLARLFIPYFSYV